MTVRIPSALQSYTGRRDTVEASGATLGEALASLDAQFPGIRFRMIDEQDTVREHIRLFVNCELHNDLALALQPRDEIQIITALSGG